MGDERRSGSNGAVVAIVVVLGIIGLLSVLLVVGVGALMLFGVRSPGPPVIQVAPKTSVPPAGVPVYADPASPPLVTPETSESQQPPSPE